MTKIDNSYLDRLREVLYDEKQAVNYKVVSIMFGVHVNIAKQMLYHFYTKEKKANKKIFATFYVSGMLPRKLLYTIGGQTSGKDKGSESTSQDSYCSPSDEMDSFLVLLCMDKDLEQQKEKFTKIFSVHVYSLSCFPLENYDVLDRLVERPLKDGEGRTPIDFGPITCPASHKLIEDRIVVPITKEKAEVSKTKEASAKSSEGKKEPAQKKDDSSFGSNIKSGNEDAKQSNNKSVKAKEVKKNDSNRLKSMFASAPPSKPKPKVNVDTDSKPSSATGVSSSRVDVNKSGKTAKESDSAKTSSKLSNKDETRKRKRIRDVLSSSESENEDKSEDDDSLPESPIPRKRIQIESDSEDECVKPPETKEDQPADSKINTKVPGRKRVTKMVSKSYIDKDGFLVTTKEQVMVSEDETSDTEKGTTTNSKSNSTSAIETKKPKLSEEAKPKSKQTKPAATTSKEGAGKTKQSSLMSFFQKK